MTQHNIIGHERSGAHVVIRQYAQPRRSAHWWLRTVIEAAVCIGFVLMIWGALS